MTANSRQTLLYHSFKMLYWLFFLFLFAYSYICAQYVCRLLWICLTEVVWFRFCVGCLYVHVVSFHFMWFERFTLIDSPVVNIAAGSVMSWGEMDMNEAIVYFLIYIFGVLEFVLVCEQKLHHKLWYSRAVTNNDFHYWFICWFFSQWID